MNVPKRVIATLLLAVVLVGAPSGCTVIPRHVSASQPSFDGGRQDSGFVGFDKDGNGIITGTARNRYNALVKLYGAKFLVPLSEDDGIKPGPVIETRQTWLIDPEHLVKFQTMARWHRER